MILVTGGTGAIRHLPPPATREHRSADGTTRSRRNSENRSWVGRSSGLIISCRTFLPSSTRSSKRGRCTRPPVTARSLRRPPRRGGGGPGHAHPAGTPRQDLCSDGKRGPLVSGGCGDHQCGDRQATVLHRRDARRSAGAPHSRRTAGCRHLERSGYLRLSARRREDSDDHDHCRRPHWPGAPEHSPNSLTKMLRSSVVRHRGCCVVG
jgi:hypothetical protein